ncbi:MAG: hypothetical protein JRG94_00745 [Deltaproteobacteria bacterium]|nr:hypothetical protein [Deltaproteobacteria bacterium]
MELDREPDYETNSLSELLDIERWINRKAHPERFARLQIQIALRREHGEPEERRAITERLAIKPIVSGAIIEVGKNWRVLLRAMILPAVAMSMIQSAIAFFGLDTWRNFALWVALCPAYVLFATSCHRVVLLGEGSIPSRWGVYWTARETRFAGWYFATSSIAVVIAFPVAFIGIFVVTLVGPADLSDYAVWTLGAVFVGPFMYFVSRASLVLPATAIDQRLSLESAWNLSHNNGWRLTASLAIPALLPTAVHKLYVSTLGIPEGLASLIAFILWYSVGAIGIAILSVAYRTLAPESFESTASPVN